MKKFLIISSLLFLGLMIEYRDGALQAPEGCYFVDNLIYDGTDINSGHIIVECIELHENKS